MVFFSAAMLSTLIEIRADAISTELRANVTRLCLATSPTKQSSKLTLPRKNVSLKSCQLTLCESVGKIEEGFPENCLILLLSGCKQRMWF